MANSLLPEHLLVGRDAGQTAAVYVTPSVQVGGDTPIVMAGPCSVESWDQIITAAREVAAAGAHVLRGGAYKPRTSPYSFQGLGDEGLALLSEAGAAVGLPIVTEVMDARDVERVGRRAHLLQVGARNMQNFTLLKELGRCDRPVLLKRGMAATLEEWLLAAEYVLAGGNPRVILCERGSRGFETYTRGTLDLGVAVAARGLSHLPVIADPSHAAGRAELVAPLARAAVAAGLDGVIVEVHPNPEQALSDGAQSLTPLQFRQLLRELGAVAARQRQPAAATA